MAKRLTKIMTRTGDDGTTGLADGSRVPKDGLRIEALGTIDELNSVVGMMRAEKLPADMNEELAEIQQRLFDAGGELSLPGTGMITESHVAQLEEWLNKYNDKLPPLKEFILPGGGRAAATCHLARAVCRRAERVMWGLHRSETVNPFALMWLNRLSDLLFVYARTLARSDGAEEKMWQHEKGKDA